MKITVLLIILLFATFSLLFRSFLASRSATSLGYVSHVITSISPLSRLISSFSLASSSNTRSRGLIEAGSTSPTNLLSSLGEAGPFKLQFFLLHDRVSHVPFSSGVSAASSIPEADCGGVRYR